MVPGCVASRGWADRTCGSGTAHSATLGCGHAALGFVLAEAIMCTTIIGAVVVGVTVLFQVSTSAFERATKPSGAADAALGLAVLERDVRYCAYVTSSSPHELVLRSSDGETIEYRWAGGRGDPLVRVGIDGPVPVVRYVQSIALGIRTADVHVPAVGTSAAQAIEVARFESFRLKAGYSTAGVPIEGVRSVHVRTAPIAVTGRNTMAVWFATGHIVDGAVPTQVRVRARRLGRGDLCLTMYSMVGETALERRSVIASGRVANAALGGSFESVSIPLISAEALLGDHVYAVELSSSTRDSAAEIEVEMMEDDRALRSWTSGLIASSDGGSSFAIVGSAPGVAQTRFSVQAAAPATKSEDGGSDVVLDVVGVSFEATVASDVGDAVVNATFTLMNRFRLDARP